MSAMLAEEEDRPRVVAAVEGRCGELVLRSAGEHFEVIANGTFLMDTRNGESERLLVTAAAARMPGPRLLLGGLGVGFSLRAALDDAAVGAVTVVEREPAVIDWNRGPLRTVHGEALAHPEVSCVEADLHAWLGTCHQMFDGICLDIDNGPSWTVDEGNGALYTEPGLDLLASRLAPGGVLGVWSAAAEPGFEAALRSRFTRIEVVSVPVPRGEPDVIYLARRD